MRCDSNVSLKPIGQAEFGTRTETKNVNSLKSVEVAVRYEMRRQAAVLRVGRRDPAGDPPLPRGRLHLARPQQGDRAGLPVLPRARSGTGGAQRRARRAAAADHSRASVVVAQADSAGVGDLRRGDARSGQHRRHRPDRRDRRARRVQRAKRAAWWGNFLVQKANEIGVAVLDALAITPAQVAAVVKLVDDGKLSNKLARQVVEGVLAGEGEPEQVMTDRGLAVVRDDSLIQAAVDEALAANPDIAEKIRGGKVQAGGRDRRRGDEGDQGPGRRRAGARTGAGRLQLTSTASPMKRPRTWCSACCSSRCGCCRCGRSSSSAQLGVIILVLTLGVWVWVGVTNDQYNQLDRRLDSLSSLGDVNTLLRSAQQSGVGPEPTEGGLVRTARIGDTTVSIPGDIVLPELPNGYADTTINGVEYRVRTITDGQRVDRARCAAGRDPGSDRLTALAGVLDLRRGDRGHAAGRLGDRADHGQPVPAAGPAGPRHQRPVQPRRGPGARGVGGRRDRRGRRGHAGPHRRRAAAHPGGTGIGARLRRRRLPRAAHPADRDAHQPRGAVDAGPGRRAAQRGDRRRHAHAVAGSRRR